MHSHMWRLASRRRGRFDYDFTCTCGRSLKIMKSQFWAGTEQSEVQSKLLFDALTSGSAYSSPW